MIARLQSCSLAALALLLAPMYLHAQIAATEAPTAAEVVEAQGDVSVIRHEQEWALFTGDRVAVGEMILTGDDGFAHLAVEDGADFLVYPNSRVIFRKNPGNLRDLIDVFLGRVRIYIEKLGGQPNPHRIFTPTAVISVRGTTFDVEVNEYETTVVSVTEGLVGVRHRILPSNKETPVGAGQSLTIDANTPLAKAGMDGVKAANIAEDVARIAASIWQQIGNRTGSGGGTGGGTTPTPRPVPGDEQAPDPPPAAPPPP
ncbi:MAG: hypothetical protein GC160_01905 [Acidobacteria bacterium]|nr:hypothetical protein [Acidobacteriota bacterium]